MATKKKSGKKTSKAAEQPGSQDEGVVKLSATDALRFGKLDAEIRNHMQGIRIADLEIEKLERDMIAQLEARKGQRNHLRLLLKGLSPQYDELIEELAKTYGVPDPKRMLIDPDSGVVRDTQNL